MKHSLNRIEALNSLEARTTSKPRLDSRKRAYSFEIRRAPQKQETAEQTTSDFPNLSEGTSSSTGVSLHPDSGKNRSVKIILPEFNFNRDSRGNKAVNPASEMNQAQEIQTVAACESQLRQIVHQIENLYMEGPIVDGWLEFCTPTSAPITTLHHDSVNHLINNGEEVIGFDPEIATNELSSVNYRLCGLDASGQKWAYPCPPDQLLSVSVAIARYQKLQQLLQQKQYLETRLKSINSN